jgi:hypothetical protein
VGECLHTRPRRHAGGSGNASAEVIEQDDGNVLRIIVTISGDTSGEVLVPLGAEVMQALAGRQSVLAISVRSASRKQPRSMSNASSRYWAIAAAAAFDVTYDTSDILFSLDFDRALAPMKAGYLVINSDISGGGKGIDLLAVRIRQLS